MPPKKHKDEFANETPREYYYRVYKAKQAGEEWTKDIYCDPSIANADKVSDHSLLGISLICNVCHKNFAEPYECKPCHFNRIIKTTQSNVWTCSCFICQQYELMGVPMDQAEKYIREKRITELELDPSNSKNKIKIEQHQRRINELIKTI